MTADFLYSKYVNKFATLLDKSVSDEKQGELGIEITKSMGEDFETMVKQEYDKSGDIMETIFYVNDVVNEFAKKLEEHFEKPILNQNAIITLIKNNLLGDVKDEISDD